MIMGHDSWHPTQLLNGREDRQHMTQTWCTRINGRRVPSGAHLGKLQVLLIGTAPRAQTAGPRLQLQCQQDQHMPAVLRHAVPAGQHWLLAGVAGAASAAVLLVV